MGYQDKNSEEKRVKSSEGRSSSRKCNSPLSRRESSPRSSSLRNRSVSPSRPSTRGDAYCRFHEEEGDLFSGPLSTSLAHCVSSDMRMGAGIAIHFRKKFGQIDNLLSQGKRVGEVAFLKDSNRYIFYLVTKNRFNDRPTESTLQQSLVEMKHLCRKLSVKKLAMPRIGCGLDGLQWPSVSTIIRKVFSGSGISITIYSLESRSPMNKSLPTYLSQRKEPFYSTKSEPLMRRDDYLKRKRSGSYDGSKDTPKRQCIGKPTSRLLLREKHASSSQGKQSPSQLKRQENKSQGKSQWETDSSTSTTSSSSSDESDSTDSAPKSKGYGGTKKKVKDSSTDEDESSGSEKFKNQKDHMVLKPEVSSEAEDKDGKSFQKVETGKVESILTKAVTMPVTVSNLKHAVPEISDIKSSISAKISDSKSPVLSKISDNKPSKAASTSWDTSSGSESSPDRKKIKSTHSSIHTSFNVNLISKNKAFSSRSETIVSVASDYSDDQTVNRKRLVTQHIDQDFLSSSDEESDVDMDVDQNYADFSPIESQPKVTQRIFIMDSPEKSPKRGLSTSLRERLGQRISNVRSTSKYEVEYEEEEPSSPTTSNNARIMKARKSMSSLQGTMYSDREGSKLSIKDRLSLGSRLGR